MIRCKSERLFAYALVVCMGMAWASSTMSSTPRVLTQVECRQIEGGRVCGAIKVIYVIGKECLDIVSGWITLKDEYNGKKDGNGTVQADPTIAVKQQTVQQNQGGGHVCGKTDVLFHVTPYSE